MNAFLAHIGLEPLVYGVIIFLGLLLMLWKFQTGRYMSLAVDGFVFWLVFTLHGGTMTGGMAAAIAAMLSGIFFPLLLRR